MSPVNISPFLFIGLFIVGVDFFVVVDGTVLMLPRSGVRNAASLPRMADSLHCFHSVRFSFGPTKTPSAAQC